MLRGRHISALGASLWLWMLVWACVQPRAHGTQPLKGSDLGAWDGPMTADGTGTAGHIVGRVGEMEKELEQSLASGQPTRSDRTSRTTRTGTLSTSLTQLDQSTQSTGSTAQRSSDSGQAVLRAQVALLQEDLDISPPENAKDLTPALDSHRLRLNILGFYAAQQGLRCATGLPGSVEEDSPRGVLARVAALQALPRCPAFQPCTVGVDSSAVPGNDVMLGEGAGSPISMCFSGIADVDAAQQPTVPLNCHSWHSMTAAKRNRLIKPFMAPEETPYGFGFVTPSRDRDAATTELLIAQPELGCAHGMEFRPPGPLAFSVFRLRHVYVSGEAVVFNRSTVFRRLGCQDGVHKLLPKRFAARSWEVKRVGVVVNLAYAQGRNFYHTLVETLPLLLYLQPLLSPRSHDTPGYSAQLPVLLRKRQAKLYSALLAPLTGVPLESLRRYEMSKKDLYQASTVYQPVYQACGRPSKAIWSRLRQHLLHPHGVPLFNKDWSSRDVGPVSEDELARVPEDWVVVVAKRPGKRRVLVQHHQIVERVRRLVGADRLVVFKGGMGILQAKALFRRARLFIATHGAALANMVFMPKGADILEIRPGKDFNSCYHALADACSLRYHLVLGKGTSNSILNVATDNVTRVVHEIVGSF